MSIDDKMEHLYRENKFSEKQGIKSRQNGLIFEGFDVKSGEYIPANATQSEPMAFCPKCNGMLLPYLEGHKCKDCGFTKGVSEELIKESKENEVRYVSSPQTKVNYYKPRSGIIKTKDEVTSTLSSEELKDKLSNLENDIFNIVIMILGVPKSLEKEDKIDFINNNYRAVRIENAIHQAENIKT